MAGKQSAKRSTRAPGAGAVQKRSTPTFRHKTPAGAQRLSVPTVVGIGASAGGLGAFRQFFAAMPADSGLAFVLVPHRDPNRRSFMSELISRATLMPVAEAEDGMPVRANRVYVVPPDRCAALRNGVLRLTGPLERGATSIDLFLRSLAEDQADRAIGIVFSGTGSHGALGLEAIKAHGGLSLVQDPKTAEYPQMPESAIATASPDRVLAVEEIPAELMKHVGQLQMERGGERRTAAESDPLMQLLAVLRVRCQFDFRCYDGKLVRERVGRRMKLRRCQHIADYVALLREDQAEAAQLVQDLLDRDTSFFRDPEAFRALDEQVLAPLVREKAPQDTIRVWVPGCATGEEAYSIAMLILERLEAVKKRCPVRIFATYIDVDGRALERARRGEYPQGIATAVSPARLARFFVPGEKAFVVKPQLRDCVTFAVQNLSSDAPFSKLDLVSCRNLLSCFDRETQQKTLALFHFALNEQGALFLGRGETVGHGSPLFRPLSERWRVYRRVATARPGQGGRAKQSSAGAVSGAAGAGAFSSLSTAEVAKHALLAEFAPAAVLIDREHQILYRLGQTSRYIELPSGKPTRDLLALVCSELRFKLRGAVHEAIREGVRVAAGPTLIRRDGRSVWVNATVVPVRAHAESEYLFLICFQELPEAAAAGAPAHGDESAEPDAALRQLEAELQQSRENWQTAIAALQTSNEELKAANEEVNSTNEELQSTNEELETSKEELESLNEELTAVNGKLRQNVLELEQAHNDIANFLNCTDIPTLFLGRDFRIKRFTPAALRLFRLAAGDVGRPLGDIALEFVDDKLLSDAAGVLDDLAPREATVQTSSGSWRLRRIMPYRTADNRIDGVVVTLVDVSQLKAIQQDLRKLNAGLEQRVAERLSELKTANAALREKSAEQERTDLSLRESRERLRALVDSAPDAVITFDEFGTIESVNPAAERMFQYRADELLGRAVKLLVPALECRDKRDALAERLKTQFLQPEGARCEVEGRRRDGSRFPLELAVGEISPLKVFTGILHDISRRRELERDLANAASLEQRRIAQDLHDSVGQDLTALRMMVKDLAETLAADGSNQSGLVEKISRGLQRASQEVRAVTRGLSPVPVDAHGLMSALSDLVDRVQNQSHISCRFECPDPVLLDDNVSATQLYRIAQEAVANAIKHADPRKIAVTLRADGQTLVLRVEDDGSGIASPGPDDEGFGLRIMHSRSAAIGATLGVVAGERGGTVVTCLMPWSKQNGQKKKKGKTRQGPDRRRSSGRARGAGLARQPSE